jgi:AGZA family xanthine/uracil permease-like MFS transporter
MDTTSVFMATAISAGFASILMGIVANYPVSLAAGMGVNAMFSYTIVIGMGMSWQGALASVFVSGLVFVLVSLTGIRQVIINAIPKNLKFAIEAGIEFFVAFVGLKNAGIIVANDVTFVGLGSLNDPTVFLALVGILVTVALVVKKVPAAVFVGMLFTAIIGLILNAIGFARMSTLPETNFEQNFTMNGIGAFTQGFGDLFANPFNAFVAIFSLLFVDFFDTAGTLVAVANRTNLIDEEGNLKDVEKALLSDSIGTLVGAALGTSTVTSFVESTSGVEVGGRTGLTAVTTAVLFLLSVFFSPLL